jgi:hypothetical protein
LSVDKSSARAAVAIGIEYWQLKDLPLKAVAKNRLVEIVID